MKVLIIFIIVVVANVSFGQEGAFRKEVESYLQQISNSEEGINFPEGNKRDEFVRTDKRNWEEVLARVISSDAYGQEMKGIAMSVIRWRGTTAHPEVVPAIMDFFESRKEALREGPAKNPNGSVPSDSTAISDPTNPFGDPTEVQLLSSMRSSFRNLFSWLVRSGDPLLLGRALTYAVSEDEKSGSVLSVYSIRTLAAELRVSANTSHLAEMEVLAKRVDDPVALRDLSEALKNVRERDPAEFSPRTETINGGQAGGDKIVKGEEEFKVIRTHDASAFPVWLILVGVLGVVIAALFIILKKRADY